MHLFGQSSHVVMTLDDLARDVERFDAVGIDGSLCQPLRPFNLAGFGIEDLDEVAANDFALLLRVGNAGEVIEEFS